MTLALELAKALNCEASEPPCGQCLPCQKIASARHADVEIVGVNEGSIAEARPRVEIGIDRIREMQHSSSLPPFEGNYKVFIIDGAELLSTEAANCLLKTLEEPIGKVVFILLTTNDQLLLPTVVSRCQRLELPPLSAAEAEAALTTSWGIEPGKAKLLSRLCHGCLGWAIRATRDDSWLQQRLKETAQLIEIITVDYEARFAYASQLAAEFGQNRGPVFERLDLWLDWWRDLLLVKVGLSEAITNIDRLAEIVDRSGRYSLLQMKCFITSIQAAKEQLRQNANPRLVLEVLMLNIPGKERAVVRAPLPSNYG
jgi:DNA polymerase-3 subunit delta'